MKRLLILCVLCASSSLAHAKLKIVTTATDFADLARQIGGEHVEVESIMRGPENVHNVIAKPTEMLKLNKADLFVHAGLDAEPWRDNLVKGARNPKVLPGKPGDVDMSRGIELLDVPSGRIDRSMGDVHAYGNPHYGLSPAAGQRMVATLTRALSDADPAHADEYKSNAVKLVNELADLHRELRDKVAAAGGLKIATYHDAWRYLADAFGIEIVGVIEPKPSITPSPADLRRTIDKAKQAGVKVVVVETYNSYDQAKFVADAIGGKVVVLPDHVNGTEGVKSYQELFRHNVNELLDAAK